MSIAVNSVRGVVEATTQQNNLMSLSLSYLILAPIHAISRVALVDRRARNNTINLQSTNIYTPA